MSIEQDVSDAVDDIGSLVASIERSTHRFWTSVSDICTSVDKVYRCSHGGQILTVSELDRLSAALLTFMPVMVGVLAVVLACIAFVLMHLVAFLHHNPMLILFLLYMPECFCHRAKEVRCIFA